MAMKDIKEVENNASEKEVKHDFSPKQSDWGLLSPMLLGKIALCDKEGTALGGPSVTGIAIDADLTMESQYSSPFENSNPESRLPVLMGMLQSGDWVNTADKVLGKVGLSFGDENPLSDETKKKLNQLEGRSNFTKVNSTQIFVSSSPVRINLVLFFEAWANALHEVEHQIATLQQWTLPKKLSQETLIGALADDMSITSLFPSEVPPFVSFLYAKKRYLPMLLETVTAPLVTPLDKNGNRLVLETNVTLVSRQAWDKSNIAQLYK
ncbi:hypothetical protein ACG9XL_17230 [Acinetobacter nosocomialis]|nr:hypothetical protein [Acinetobacter baumannii]MDC5568440.1 hypothetical protein [Acinetobacter baumannii]MDK2172846.1 hypothetical protein [Acinetobacter baumannii]MDK2183702.1 hypothetical protein [Acinetobacter baumannii]MDK2329526.1 hypothetical protein [Acinetobacter baumannii]